MRKEILVAIVLGFGIGLVVVFGILTARTALEEHQGTNRDGASSPLSPTPTPVAATITNTLTITDPQDGAVTQNAKITIRGTTSADASIVLSTEKGDVIVTADNTGSFSQDVELVNGVNDIQVVSFSKSQERSDAHLTVVYSTADF